MRLGILGGTFDPPHLGHLLLAEVALDALGLDRILFVPVGGHPIKKDGVRSPVENRVEMLQLAIADNPRFELSRVDLDRDPPHYTADMLTLLKQIYPQADLYFLMGMDNLRELPKWSRPQAVYRQAQLVVLRRSDEVVAPNIHADLFPDLAERVILLDSPLLSIWLSSSQVVERLRAGQSVRYLVPDAVLAYIHAHELYKDSP